MRSGASSALLKNYMDKKNINVKYIASLAKLELTSEEELQFENEMRQFADFAHCLEQFPPDSIEADRCRSISDPCFREDNVNISDTNVLSNAKSVHDGYITVPVTVESPSESEAKK